MVNCNITENTFAIISKAFLQPTCTIYFCAKDCFGYFSKTVKRSIYKNKIKKQKQTERHLFAGSTFIFLISRFSLHEKSPE